jgi:hypothetical protein
MGFSLQCPSSTQPRNPFPRPFPTPVTPTTPTHAPTAHNTSCVSGVCRKLFISWVSLTESLRLIMAPILPRVFMDRNNQAPEFCPPPPPCLHRIISAFFQPFLPLRLSACARSCLFQPAWDQALPVFRTFLFTPTREQELPVSVPVFSSLPGTKPCVRSCLFQPHGSKPSLCPFLSFPAYLRPSPACARSRSFPAYLLPSPACARSCLFQPTCVAKPCLCPFLSFPANLRTSHACVQFLSFPAYLLPSPTWARSMPFPANLRKSSSFFINVPVYLGPSPCLPKPSHTPENRAHHIAT